MGKYNYYGSTLLGKVVNAVSYNVGDMSNNVQSFIFAHTLIHLNHKIIKMKIMYEMWHE